MKIYLSENIKRLRLGKGLTQEALAVFLGVTSQSISNWERSESYPDITLLPEIASFFRISLDELMGTNRAEKEKIIEERLTEYDNLTDEKLMCEIIQSLKEEYPNDFRVLIRYLGCIVRYTQDLPSVTAEVFKIYNNIRQNCTDDRIRIKAKRIIIEFYRSQVGIKNSKISFEMCEKIISEMPDMRDCREMFSYFYPQDHPEYNKKIQDAIEENFTVRLSLFTHYYFFNENCTDKWQIQASEKEAEMLEFIYDDGNYGKQWRTMMNLYGHIGTKYNNIGDTENALKNFRKAAELAIEFDNMDRVTIMHSTMFEGKEFDKHRLGSTFTAKSRVRELLTEKYNLPDEIKATDGFKEIISTLE